MVLFRLWFKTNMKREGVLSIDVGLIRRITIPCHFWSDRCKSSIIVINHWRSILLKIGRIFASLKVKPKRSIIVALFGAEEMGLKGSGYFSTHIPEQCSKIIGMLNFDMVGEGDGAECDYSTPEIKKILLKAALDAGILRNSRPMEKTGVQSSDFVSFVKQGIPCISFSSNGPYISYHQSGDTLYRLNPEIMADIAVLGFRTGYLLADQE